MVGIIILIIIVILLVLYLTGLPFELGTGSTEMKHKAREGKYTVVDKEKTKEGSDEVKLLE